MLTCTYMMLRKIAHGTGRRPRLVNKKDEMPTEGRNGVAVYWCSDCGILGTRKGSGIEKDPASRTKQIISRRPGKVSRCPLVAEPPVLPELHSGAVLRAPA